MFNKGGNRKGIRKRAGALVPIGVDFAWLFPSLILQPAALLTSVYLRGVTAAKLARVCAWCAIWW